MEENIMMVLLLDFLIAVAVAVAASAVVAFILANLIATRFKKS